MKRGRKIALMTAVIIWVVLLGFTVYYLYGFYSSLNQPIPTSEVYSQKRVSLDGSEFRMAEGDIISFEAGENDFSMKMYSVRPTNAKFVINNFLYFEMSAGREKRIDLDGDSVYDVLVRLHSLQGLETSVSIRAIQEEKSFSGGLADTVEQLGSNSTTQSKLVILILLVFALILVAYVTKEYVIPTIEEKRRMSRKSELETFNDLRYKFEESKRSGDKEKAQKIFDKLRHLHRYMDDSDQQKTKRAVAEMANYLK